MALNEFVKLAIENQFQQQTGRPLEIKQAKRVHGGDISTAFQLETTTGDLFLKCGNRTSAGDFFKKEYDGLRTLINSNSLSVPQPLFYGNTEQGNFLVLEFIKKSAPQKNFWQLFAERLALMHHSSHAYFGLEQNNFIGSLPQSNQPQNSWAAFYASERLEPLLKECMDQGLLSTGIMKYSEHLMAKLPDIFPEEKPALLHGDLWGGNYLPGPGGVPYIFDPAVYYGNREMDLAMTRLFGGFDRKFYWHYEEYFPLAPGWQERISVCQLYPLLVHALLFGGGYVQQVRNTLSAY